MPTKTTSDPLAGLRLPPVYEWVDCELPEVNEGLVEPLKIKVLVNPMRAEVLSLGMEIDAIFARARERVQNAETPAAINLDAIEQDDREAMDLIAPRIVDWNLIAENEQGERVTVWAPAKAPGALMLLNPRQRGWVLRIVQSAHLGSDARSKLSRPREVTASGEGAKTPSGPQIVDIPSGETRPRRRKSS